MAFVWRWIKTLLPYDGITERRRFPRYSCNYRLEYNLLGEPVRRAEATIDNISKVGVRIKSDRNVNKGDIVRMNIQPDIPDRIISAYGLVRWAKEAAAGIEFLEIEPFDVDMLISSSN